MENVDRSSHPSPASAPAAADLERAKVVAREAQFLATDRSHLGRMVYVNDLVWALGVLAAAPPSPAPQVTMDTSDAVREPLLEPLRARCRAIGVERYRLAAPQEERAAAVQPDLHAAIYECCGEGYFDAEGTLWNATASTGYLGLRPEDKAAGCRIEPVYRRRDARHAAAEQIAAVQPTARMPLTLEQVTEISKRLYGPEEHEGAWTEHSLDMMWVKSIAMPLVRAAEAAHGIASPSVQQEKKE